jgi:hypothetical protein
MADEEPDYAKDQCDDAKGQCERARQARKSNSGRWHVLGARCAFPL